MSTLLQDKTAEASLIPAIGAAATIRLYCTTFGEIGFNELVGGLALQTQTIGDGDLGQIEAMLLAQAHTLDAIFNSLAQRAACADHMGRADSYLRLAFKAQTQCRATLQTLGDVKNPQPVAFVKQANISNGPQQINNGDTLVSRAPTFADPEKNQNQQNELLEEKSHEQLDARTPGTASGINQAMAAMEEIDWAENG